MTLVDGKVEFDRSAYLEERRIKAEAKAAEEEQQEPPAEEAAEPAPAMAGGVR